jgi:hypothetical protein
MKHEDRIVLEIYDALEALGDAFPLAQMDAKYLHEFLQNIEPLTDAVKREDWSLIAVAAQMRTPGKVTMLVDLLTRRLAWEIYTWPEAYGLEEKPTKSEILAIIQVKFPPLYARLPMSPRGLSIWWKSVGCEPKQTRGYPSPSLRKLLNSLERPR